MKWLFFLTILVYQRVLYTIWKTPTRRFPLGELAVGRYLLSSQACKGGKVYNTNSTAGEHPEGQIFVP
jgi:hypothetical protein